VANPFLEVAIRAVRSSGAYKPCLNTSHIVDTIDIAVERALLNTVSINDR